MWRNGAALSHRTRRGSRRPRIAVSGLGLLLLLAGTSLPLGRAFAWPGPEDGDPGPTDNVQSLTYPDTLGQPPDGSSLVSGIAGQLGTSHYFTANGSQPIPLVGVSADNACHFNATGSGQCNYANYAQKITDDATAGLNVIRLWVNVGGLPGNASNCTVNTSASDPNDQPFTYNNSNLQGDGLGRRYLDVKNPSYFQRLYNVVNYAAGNNMFVEITLFSPMTANLYLGPWSSAHAYLQGGTKLSGFSDAANFVNAGSSEYHRMYPYLFNVVHWTVDTLHSFPNLYFEIANEPEWISPTQTLPCGWGAKSETTPATVATWQATIASELKRYEAATYAQNHLVAVEPLTTTDAGQFMGTALYAGDASVVNSHYTNVNPLSSTGLSAAGLGAIRLVRQYNNQAKIFGFNETKITGGTGCTASGTAQSVDSGRAEAWEFMTNQGGVYDQFGYACYSPDYYETRRQMGVMRNFLAGAVNIGRNLKTSSSSSPSWVNPGAYAATEGATGSNKFWAAVEPTSTAANKRWLLYVHHSLDRHRVFDGYQEVITTAAYQEHLSVCLGAASGTYRAQWIDPKNAMLNGVVQTLQPPTTINWTGSSSYTPGGAGSFTLPSPPHYNYDIALLISV